MSETFSVKSLLGLSWGTIKQHPLFLAKVFGLVFLVTIPFAVLESFFPEDSVRRGLMESLTTFVSTFLLFSAFVPLIPLIRTNEEGAVRGLFLKKDIFWKALGATLLYHIMVSIGFLLFIIPGIYLAIRYQFFFYILIEKNLPIAEAFRESSRLTEGRRLDLFRLGLWSMLIILASLLTLGVALVITVPLVTLAMYYAYEQISREKNGESVTPLASSVEVSQSSKLPATLRVLWVFLLVPAFFSLVFLVFGIPGTEPKDLSGYMYYTLFYSWGFLPFVLLAGSILSWLLLIGKPGNTRRGLADTLTYLPFINIALIVVSVLYMVLFAK